LDLSGGVKAQLAQYTVGDVVTLPATNSAQAFTVRKPDGSEVKLTAGGRFAGTDLPGLYTIVSVSSTQRFAVNLDWAESRTAPLPIEELERLRLPLKVNAPEFVRKEAQRRVRLHEAELEQRQKVWRWLLVSALVVLVLETALAGWITRRRLEAEPA
jgi:hypothetical protein